METCVITSAPAVSSLDSVVRPSSTPVVNLPGQVAYNPVVNLPAAINYTVNTTTVTPPLEAVYLVAADIEALSLSPRPTEQSPNLPKVDGEATTSASSDALTLSALPAQSLASQNPPRIPPHLRTFPRNSIFYTRPPPALIRPFNPALPHHPRYNPATPISSTPPSKAPIRPGDRSLPPHLRCLPFTSTSSLPPNRSLDRAADLAQVDGVHDPALAVDGQSAMDSEEECERKFVRDEHGIVDITDDVDCVGDGGYYSESEFDEDDDTPNAAPIPVKGGRFGFHSVYTPGASTTPYVRPVGILFYI